MLFASNGYEGTSLQDIAKGLGASKSGLLYHFGSKPLILRELMVPVAAALATLDRQIAELGGQEAQRRAIDGFVDIVLGFRHELSAYPAAIKAIVELPELADLQFEAMGRRLFSALVRGSSRSVDLAAAHVVCVGMIATAQELVGLSPEQLRSDLITVAERALAMRSD